MMERPLFLLLWVTAVVADMSMPPVKEMPREEKNVLFASKVLRCEICKAMAKEVQQTIEDTDPKKKVETADSFRIDPSGRDGSRIMVYRRSVAQMNDIVDSLCKGFDNYVQAMDKETGQVTVVPIVDSRGKMSSSIFSVDVVPDDDLNARLKFYCEGIMEEFEDDFREVFKKESSSLDEVSEDLCHKRTKLCQKDGDKDTKEEL